MKILLRSANGPCVAASPFTVPTTRSMTRDNRAADALPIAESGQPASCRSRTGWSAGDVPELNPGLFGR